MSNLSNIYAHMAGIAVTFGTKTPAVYPPGSLKSLYAPADLPARLLMPLDVGTAGNMPDYLDADGNQQITWRVSDLLLLQAIGQNGQAANSADVLAYIDAYATALKSNRYITASTLITGWDVDAGIREYPLGSDRFYYAVIFLVTVLEID